MKLFSSKSRFVLILFFYTVFGSHVHIFAQSSYVDSGFNGAMLSAGIAIDRNGISNASALLGNSIGGFLDLGVVLKSGSSTWRKSSAQDITISILYSTMVMKQDDVIPLSLQISGSYGFSSVTNKALEEIRAQKEGTGYSFSILLFRDFFFFPLVRFRIGAATNYEAYRFVTSLRYTPPPDEPTEYQFSLK